MRNIGLRRVKAKDLQDIGRCYACKQIPEDYLSQNQHIRIKDYLDMDMENEMALVIVNKETDKLLGLIEAVLDKDVVDISFCVMLPYQGEGVGKAALELFVQYIMRNNSDVKKLTVAIDKANIAAQKVMQNSKFSLSEQDKVTETWNLEL